MKRLSLGVAIGLTSMLTSFVASAQDTQTPPPSQTTPAPSDPAATPGAAPATAAPAATPEAAPAAAQPAPAEPPDEGHFRWGLSPAIGTFFPGPTTLSFGLEGRFGYAFNQTVTAFGSVGSTAGLGFGGDSDANGASLSVSAISYWYIGAQVDALLAGPLFVGAGAAVGKGAWGVVSASASNAGGSTETIAAGGFMPSFNGRLGLHLGKLNEKTGKRPGFAIALDLRMLVAPDSVETKTSAGTGGGNQTVTTDTTAIGYSPMLMLGYDLR